MEEEEVKVKFTKNFWMKMIPMFILVITTIILSFAVYARMMETERESCWERLEIATNNTAGKIKVRLDDNINFLEAVSNSYILTHNIEDTKEVGKYLASVVESTIFERIDVIQPDNRAITHTGEIVERGGILTYEELVTKGTYVSNRVTSSFSGREVICCVTPIEEDGEVLGILVGTIDCGTLSKLFEVFTYGGEAQLFLIDCTDGKYIIDNWHEELGNIYDLGERKSIEGDEMIDMVPIIINREKARLAYVSATNGADTYQYSIPVDGYNWELSVAVQEDIAFAHAYQLRRILQTVGVLEALIVVIYIVWNIVLTVNASRNEEKARLLEYENIKNEARTKFISNMSHDLKTPLNGIVGMLQIIENHRDDEQKVNDCLRKIGVSTQYLSTLASDMLDINAIENNKLVLQEKSMNLRQLIDELEIMLKKRAEEDGVIYHMDLSNLTHPDVIGSDVHLKRVLINLVTNAIKYSKNAGKTIWITVSDEEILYDKSRRMYKFIIKDNGIGMSEEFQKNMYKAFEQEKIGARSEYQGYGLGLTIVHFLVKKMNGKIHLESEKDVGSTFTVSIPFRIDKNGDGQKQEPQGAVSLAGMNILVVEDNEFNMEVAETLLTDAGATVSIADNGKIATEMFAASKIDSYDVILMDIMMPIMDGYESTRVIRAMERPDAKTVPIIAMSASTFSEEIQRCIDAGMNTHVAKPLDVKKLMTEMAKYSKTEKRC